MNCTLFFASTLLIFPLLTFAQQKTNKTKEEDYEKKEQAAEKYEYAQVHSSWYREMLKNHPDIKKAERDFDKYFSTHPGESTKLKDRFESWIQAAGLYKDKKGIGI